MVDKRFRNAIVTLFLLAPLAVVWARSGKTKYGNRTLTLGLGFTAKEMCSCLFVEERTEAECRDYTKLEQITPTIKIDRTKKTVKASYQCKMRAHYFRMKPRS